MDARRLCTIAAISLGLALGGVPLRTDAAGSSLSAAPADAYTGTAITFTAVANTAASTGNYRIDFADGASATFPATGTVTTFTTSHTYVVAGNYVPRLFDTFGNPLAQTAVTISPQAATLALSPNPSAPGGAVAITITVATDPSALPPGQMLIAYGDGATAMTPYRPQTVAHTYALPGTYTVSLTSAQGRRLATAVQTVVAAPPPPTSFFPARTPVGQIYTTTLTLSPVLAGGSTSIVVRYALADRALPPAANAVVAYVELLAPNGAQLAIPRRSDPFEIPAGGSAGIQTAVIPYDVPVDGGGRYALRVILRSVNGGTIARSDLLPFMIAAGPDPAPSIKTEFRASGALEVGTNAAGHGTFNPGLSTALQFPAYALGITGLYDPVSRRPDPLFTLTAGGPGPISSPDSTPAPDASPNPNSTPAPSASPGFKDTFGRTTAALPDLLGGGTTLRGLDLNRTAGQWTLHGAIGATQSGTASTSPERATVVDIARKLGSASARVAFFDRTDDVTLAPGAVSAQSSMLEVSSPLLKYLTFAASGGTSAARSLVGSNAVSDASTKTVVNYTRDTTTASFEYHNAGDAFAVGAGPGATADRAGYLSSLAFHLTPKMAFTLGSSRDDTRSTLQRQTDAFGTLSLQIGTQAQLQLGVRRDTQSSASARTTADQLNLTFATPLRDGSFSFNASVVGLSDAINSANASATRTAALQYMHQKNAHTLAAGVTATAAAGAAANAQVGESLTYGFPIGGRLVDGMLVHGFELQFAATNTSSASGGTAPGRDSALSTILSYHLNSHIAIGVRSEIHQRGGSNAVGAPPPSALRLRLDVTQ